MLVIVLLLVGKTGWLVPPQNPTRLAKVIEIAFNEIGSKNWNKKKKQSKNKDKNNFDISKMINSLNMLWIKNLNG